MQTPLEITFKGFEDKGEMTDLINEKVKKLEQFCDHITSCHIIIEQIKHAQRKGHSYDVLLDIKIPPHHEIAIRRHPEKGETGDDYLSKIIRETFAAAQRQTKVIVDKQHQKVKAHTKERMHSKSTPEEEDLEDLALDN